MIGGRVLDPTAVLAAVSGTSTYMEAVMHVADELNIPLAVGTTALQTAWAHAEPDQRIWLDVLTEGPTVVVLDLNEASARDAGLISAQSGNPDVHLAAAQSVLIGLQRQWPVVTASPDLLLALSPEIRTETIP
jgi:hypothetical protein